MVTPTIDPSTGRTRWLRRSAAAAAATVVLGITGTGLAVGIVSARQPDTSGGAQATTDTDNSGASSSSGSSNGSSSSNDGSGSSDDGGLGSAQQGAPAQGGSHGS